MEQPPSDLNKQNENKNSINIPPVPSVPPVSPVSSGSPVASVAPPIKPVAPVPPITPPAQSSMRSELENRRLDLENTPSPDIISKPPVITTTQGNGQEFKLASAEVQGPKPPLVAASGSKLPMIVVALVLIAVLGIGGYYFYTKDKASQPESSPVIATPASTPTADKTLDSDKDGLPDSIEKVLGTYMTKADTDGDGFADLQEIKNGYNPLVAGAAGKYYPEEWVLVKEKIKTENKEFYEKEFGASASLPSPSPASSSSFVFPDDYKLKDSEIPAGFHYKPVSDENKDYGYSTNPGFLLKDSGGELVYRSMLSDIDPAKVDNIYVSFFDGTTGQSEVGFLVVKLNYGLPEEFNLAMKKINLEKGYIYLRDDKNILIIVGSINSDKEMNDIANKLQSRLGLKKIEANK
jgi:hypothetical protein